MRAMALIVVFLLTGCVTPCELGKLDALNGWEDSGYNCEDWWDAGWCTESAGTLDGNERQSCCEGVLALELCAEP